MTSATICEGIVLRHLEGSTTKPEPPRSLVFERAEVAIPQTNHAEEEYTYPDGGLHAMLVLVGCSCTAFAGLALLNCPGALQAWLVDQELRDESVARLGWIFGFYTFVSFFAGIQIGPVFDAYGPRALACTGSVLVLTTYLALGVCKTYWQFFITLGLCGGIGTSIALTCAVSTVQLWFFKHRGVATAAACCGSSVGGIVFPLAMEKLFPRIGFAWTLRVIALIILPFLVAGCTLMRRPRSRRTEYNSISWRSLVFEPRLLISPDIAIITLGTYLLEWGLFIVLTYLSSYALEQGMDFRLSFHLLTYLNCGSVVGRLVAGFIGDIIGRFNTQVVALVLCAMSVLAMWMTAGDIPGVIVSFAVIFGFASGSNLSLTPVCVGQLCGTEKYGRTYTAVYSVTSIG